MCTFHDDRHVTVCDVSIGRVRSSVLGQIPDLARAQSIRFIEVEGEGTRVEAAGSVDGARFSEVVRSAIAEAQAADAAR